MPESHSALGKVTYDVTNRALSDAVGSFPAKISCARALAWPPVRRAGHGVARARGISPSRLLFHCCVCRFSLASYVIILADASARPYRPAAHVLIAQLTARTSQTLYTRTSSSRRQLPPRRGPRR